MKKDFQTNKIERLLKAQGQQFNFVRKGKNEFGETDNTDLPQISTLVGVYHEQNSYISLSESEASVIPSKPIPMILTTYQRYKNTLVLPDDKVSINGRNFKVTGITNIQEGNYGIDISLEVYNE